MSKTSQAPFLRQGYRPQNHDGGILLFVSKTSQVPFLRQGYRPQNHDGGIPLFVSKTSRGPFLRQGYCHYPLPSVNEGEANPLGHIFFQFLQICFINGFAYVMRLVPDEIWALILFPTAREGDVLHLSVCSQGGWLWADPHLDTPLL